MIRKTITEISVKDLSVGFSKPVATGINFSLKAGDRLSLQGPSGGGKSTLLKTLAGLLEPTHGNVFINNIDMSELSFEEFLPLRLNIGVAFDLGGLLNNRTIWDNLMLPMLYHKLYDLTEGEARADRVSGLFGLTRYKFDHPSNVPGGIRKAACVARAILMDPQVVYLDEPTTGLNQEGLRALDFEMRRLVRRDAIVIFSTRDVEFEKGWANAFLSVDENQSEFSRAGSAA